MDDNDQRRKETPEPRLSLIPEEDMEVDRAGPDLGLDSEDELGSDEDLQLV